MFRQSTERVTGSRALTSVLTRDTLSAASWRSWEFTFCESRSFHISPLPVKYARVSPSWKRTKTSDTRQEHPSAAILTHAHVADACVLPRRDPEHCRPQSAQNKPQHLVQLRAVRRHVRDRMRAQKHGESSDSQGRRFDSRSKSHGYLRCQGRRR